MAARSARRRKAPAKKLRPARAGAPTGAHPPDVIARVLGITARHVQRLADDGVLPKVGRGQYLLVPCVQAYIKYWQDKAESRGAAAGDNSLDAARTRKTQAEAELAEIELAAARARYLPIERHEERYRQRCDALSARVRGLGQYIGDVQLAASDTAAAALLERISDALLRSLLDASSDELPLADDNGNDGDTADAA